MNSARSRTLIAETCCMKWRSRSFSEVSFQNYTMLGRSQWQRMKDLVLWMRERQWISSACWRKAWVSGNRWTGCMVLTSNLVKPP